MLIYLAYCSYLSVLVPLFILLRDFKQHVKIPFLIAFGSLLLAALISDFICYLMSKMDLSSIPIINIYFIVQFCLLSYMYSFILKNRGLIAFFVSAYLSFSLVNSLLVEPFNQIQSWSDGVQSVLLMILAVTCHIQMLKNPSRDEQFNALVLWGNLGVLFYFSLNLYLFISSNYIFTFESTEKAMITWGFHNFFNIVKNVLFAVGIYNYTKLEFRRNKEWKEQHS